MVTIDTDRTLTILVVDDDRLLRGLAVEMLDDEGYSVMGVGSAAEALTRLQSSPEITLLITDINMPGMDGLELARAARAQFPAVKLLVISGREQIARSLVPQPAEFLQKPFSAQAFLTRVHSLINP